MKKIKQYTSAPERWQAIQQRDPLADGLFIYAVTTTGVYCRPVCSSRLPNRDNIQYFDTWQQAEKAGFRPCKRCRPNMVFNSDETVQMIIKMCKYIAEADEEPSLHELASVAGKSPFYFQRLFKKIVGVTPKQYAREIRKNRVQRKLKVQPVTRAIYESGYESGSRFYENVGQELGMRPREYQKGGAGISIQYTIVHSYLGWCLVAITDRGVCRIDFGETPEILDIRLQAQYPHAELRKAGPKIHQMIIQVLTVIDAPEKGHNLPLDIQGTAFQRRVWMQIQKIRPGETASYSDIAKQSGNPKAARAVARACASNPVAVVIPCHRVIRENGEPGGYHWGVERKGIILERESLNTNNEKKDDPESDIN